MTSKIRTLLLALVGVLAAALPQPAHAAPPTKNTVDFTARNQWIWYQNSSLPMKCMNGNPTGFGYYIPSTWNGNVMFFLDGGGMCYDAQSCSNPAMSPTTVLADIAANIKPGPNQVPYVFRTGYDATNFNTDTTDTFNVDVNGAGWFKGTLNRGIFDHTSTINPLKNYMSVFLPYCTGDMHVGNRLDNSSGVAGRTASGVNFQGLIKSYYSFYAVLQAAYTQLGNHYPSKVVLSGGSAGGFGSDFIYNMLRTFLGTSSSSHSQIITVSDGGVPLYAGHSNDGVTWANQGYTGRPGFPASAVTTMEEWMADAWGANAGWSAYLPNASTLAESPTHDGYKFIPMQKQEVTNWLNASNSSQAGFGDKFAIIDGTSDWMYYFYFPLYMNDDAQGRHPTVGDAQNQLINAVTLSVFFPVSNTATSSGPLPWYKHHGYLEDDVSVWGPTGSNVSTFLSHLPL